MKHPDEYAKREHLRTRAYRKAYESPEARAWAAALTPEQRERAQDLGLLAPYIDPAPGNNSIETLPCALEPRAEDKRDEPELPRAVLQRLKEAGAHPAWRTLLGDDEAHRGEMLLAFVMSSPQPKLCWACLSYLAGDGTCKSHAQQLGMSRQAFHYHVRTLEKQLGLPPQKNQRSKASRRPYRSTNRKQG